ncbi:SRPBCC family protein [Williamsia maris]|uniref:Polyketide cyclase/dehydrase/lipid transport protein n=1 Tax=Williamsia maris TaxID=72806 RepID=A0ABT1HCN0_9NOCA|nr:SRPBCC family protein [Williamsia maris]MCP2175475.1 hypothetical protein [Williamsia maris]
MATHTLEPFELDFFDSAPIAYRFSVDLPISPAGAWAEFSRQNTLDWCRLIKKITFTSDAPYGVGTTRSAVLAPGGLHLSEYFFDWTEDPGAGRYRNAFRVVESNVPSLRRFGEMTEIVPAEHGSRLTWAFAIELAGPAARLPGTSAAAAPLLSTLRTDTVKHFADLS